MWMHANSNNIGMPLYGSYKTSTQNNHIQEQDASSFFWNNSMYDVI